MKKKLSYQNNDGLNVNRLLLNYGMKNENPADHVKFYDKNLPNKVFKLEKSQVSYLVPEQFEELNIRIFTKDHKKINLFKFMSL
ncbi:hypothetical protein C1646_765907 [Rhizophagus diaphanus]|nr:hypothetical protein C1646_765907 [Rhizophagus diaphanus] [Rhizophagus sp. MUCL 43196]